MKFVISTFLLTMITLTCWSQGKSYLNDSLIKLGQQTELIYEFSFPKEQGKVVFQQMKSKIPCAIQQLEGKINENNKSSLEILKQFKDTLFKQSNQIYWRGSYFVTAWDTGFLIIPSASLLWMDSIYELPSIRLHVIAPKLVEGKDIYGIKEQFVEVPNDSLAWFQSNWLIILLLVFLIVIFIWILKRRKIKKKTPPKELNLKEKSIIALQALEKAQLWQKNQLKEHYFELSYLLRSYLSARFELNLLEKTSQQSTLLLTQKGLTVDVVQTIRMILDYSDMAKFANSAPTELEIHRNLSQVKQIIIETSPIEIINAK